MLPLLIWSLLTAQPHTCTVAPDPVHLATDTHYTVTAQGATPGEYYEVTDRQPRHPSPDESRVWLGQADATGTVTAQIGVADGRVYGDLPESLWPGDVALKVVRYRTGGGPGGAASLLATCGFTVEP